MSPSDPLVPPRALGSDPGRGEGVDPEPGLELHVEGSVPAPADEVWAALFSPETMAAWVRGPGGGAPEAPGPGPFGGAGEGSVHVLEPRRHLRLTWHPEGWPGPSTIHVRVSPSQEGSTVSFHQVRIPGDGPRETRREVLEDALGALRRQLGGT